MYIPLAYACKSATGPTASLMQLTIAGSHTTSISFSSNPDLFGRVTYVYENLHKFMCIHISMYIHTYMQGHIHICI
jgi:hypothetical protein